MKTPATTSVTYNKEEKVWYGPKRHLFHDFDCSVGNVMFTAMRNHPDIICQISDSDGKEMTNKETLELSIRIARQLKLMGMGQSDVVGIAAKNSSLLTPVIIGCFLNCSPFHAVHPILDEGTLTHLFGLTKPKIIFCDGENYEKILKASKATRPRIFTLNDHVEGVPRVESLLVTSPAYDDYRPERLAQGGAQTVAILCSSGTTGRPKAVCISNHTLFANAGLVSGQDVIHTPMAIDWLSGLYSFVWTFMWGCRRIITQKSFSPEYYVYLAQKYKVTFSMVAPRHLATLLSCPVATAETLASLRLIFLAGGCIGFPSLQRLQLLLPHAIVSFAYGCTEAAYVSRTYEKVKNASVGQLLPGVSVRIVNDQGENVGPNVMGEVYSHHGLPWNGYYNCPEETKGMQDDAGWFHTGDLGYVDHDQYLYVVDRKKDILKCNGMHYWPTEIEEVISEMADVVDVCVIGVPDERLGDSPGALVVRVGGSQLSDEAVKAYVAKRLPVAYKQLHAGVYFVDRLPQNANGKTMKKEAKALFESLNRAFTVF